MSQPAMLNETDLRDILNGACLLGSGGGGPLAIGEQLLDALLHTLPHPVCLADPDFDVPDDALMAVSAVIGSPDAANAPTFPYDIARIAFSALEATQKPASGKSFGFVLAGETGAGNSLIPMTVAAALDLPLVDGDGARRAIPSLNMVTYAAHNLPLSPIVLANSQQSLTFSAASAAEADARTRLLVSGGGWTEDAGVAFWQMTGATMRQAIIPHTVTYARELGAALREAKAKKADAVAATCAFLGGRVLFQGQITNSAQQTGGGFDTGAITLTAPDGRQAWIYNQNENLMLWDTAHATPLAMAPDLICYLTTDGQPFSNADLALAKDKEVAIIGAACAPAMRAPSIVAAFLALFKTIGYAGPYVPFAPA